LIACSALVSASAGPRPAASAAVASILVYHRFGDAVTDAMTVRTATFRRQLDVMRERGVVIVPLRQVVEFVRGGGPPLPPRAVVLTADDGHRTVYTDMWPALRDAGAPATLFIYPSAISNASYAMTWHQLRTLGQTGLIDVQSHAYWHPNFAVERKRLAAAEYDALVTSQLGRARSVVEQQLGGRVDLIAWPFGRYDDDLLRRAADCGYVAGLTLDARPVTTGDNVMALPRYLVGDSAGAGFVAMLPGGGR
jgi:peptidoglycan/xylan/chitin deacetylase (PgdA/CDA1 family)